MSIREAVARGGEDADVVRAVASEGSRELQHFICVWEAACFVYVLWNTGMSQLSSSMRWM